jgi:two-component system sensor histidine kinase RpfC
MRTTARSTLQKTVIQRVRERLSNRPDSEHELTFNRLALSLVAFLCLFIGYLAGAEGHQQLLDDIGFYFFLYTIATFLLFLHLLAQPGISVARRLIGIPLDIGVVAYLMHAGGEITSFVYPIFLWAIFGNGFRFGVRYLFAASAFGFCAFLAVVITTPFWYENRELSAGLLGALIVLPVYVSVFIRRLSEAKRQAEEASRVKGLFLASISHELRTPLNAVIGLSDVLVSSNLNRDQSDMVRTIGKSGRLLLSLINSLLDLSRMEHGKKPQMGEFDLHELLRDVRNMLLVQAQERGIGLVLHFDLALPQKVIGSTRHFEEVLINLVGNAIKFTSHGYVLIEASRISEAEDEGLRLRFEVTDTGIGIAPDAQARIFESFTQADETIIDRFGGTGLGLSIARQLVEAHGGQIGVESVPGRGSTFWFEIMVGLAAEAPALTTQPPVTRVFSQDRALLGSLRDRIENLTSLESFAALDSLLKNEKDDAGILLIDERFLPAGGDIFETFLNDLHASRHVVFLMSASPSHVSRAMRRHFLAVLPLILDDRALQQAIALAAGFLNPQACASEECFSEQASHPLHVLVAEDNRTNQLVIGQILARGGHRVTMVENGDLAIDALLCGNFDLVLMDLNMPVMNGIEAAKFYRFAAAAADAVPIVALTADVTEETARKCREAGMRDCLSKPINAAQLLSVVAEYSGRQPNGHEKAIAAAPVSVSSPVARLDPIDEDALRNLAALGGDSFVAEIVSQFIKDAADVLAKLAQAVSVHDVDGFRDHAHALRSCAANVGAQAVYRKCLDLRVIEAQELVVDGERHMRQLEAEFEQARAFLMPYVR